MYACHFLTITRKVHCFCTRDFTEFNWIFFVFYFVLYFFFFTAIRYFFSLFYPSLILINSVGNFHLFFNIYVWIRFFSWFYFVFPANDNGTCTWQPLCVLTYAIWTGYRNTKIRKDLEKNWYYAFFNLKKKNWRTVKGNKLLSWQKLIC